MAGRAGSGKSEGVSVIIDGMTPDGDGTGLDDRGRRWVVARAVPGATVRAVGKRKDGRLLEEESPPPDGVPPACAHFGLCGGCQLQSLSVERQRAEKQRMLADLLAPLGGTDHGIIGGDAYAYRNKMEFSFGGDRYLSRAELNTEIPRAGRFLGLHAPGRFDRIVDVERCHLIDDAMHAVYAAIRQDVLASPWPMWNPKEHTGFWRHLLLRAGEEGVLAVLYTASGSDEQAAWLAERAPRWGAVGVQWVENEGRADVATGALRAQLMGQPTVTVRLGDVRFRISPTSFFQVNLQGAELLLAQVKAFIGPGGPLLDLYCGIGALGLGLASQVDSVTGVELNPVSIDDARQNAAENGINASFYAGAVEAVVPTLALPERPVVVVDPPRAGLHPTARAFLADLDARVLVYVSCRPTSLLRDGQALLAAGWRCTDRIAVDLFPQTGHVEVVSRWER